MLSSFGVTGFKSLSSLERVPLAPLTLLFGPNAAGKSNFIDALQVVSRIATANTLNEALGPPVRGLPLEAFTLPQGGLAEQLERTSQESLPRIRFAAETQQQDTKLLYEIEVAIAPSSGTLSVQDEMLRRLNAQGKDQGKPIIELDESRTKLRVRRKSKPAHPWEELVGLNHSLLSNNRYSGKEYAAIEGMRSELRGFRSYFLDPRTAMRSAQPPQDVSD
ncbi:MAG: AAA family ATPase, partial [Polyangiaceae bacterium]|nr:AAA family ATPase [Polyangiaceae bacterium]